MHLAAHQGLPSKVSYEIKHGLDLIAPITEDRHESSLHVRCEEVSLFKVGSGASRCGSGPAEGSTGLQVQPSLAASESDPGLPGTGARDTLPYVV